MLGRNEIMVIKSEVQKNLFISHLYLSRILLSASFAGDVYILHI